jgi:Na+/alanine symporter
MMRPLMRKLPALAVLMGCFMALLPSLHAQQIAVAQGLDQQIDAWFGKVTQPFVGLIFLKIKIRAFGLALRTVRGKYSRDSDPGEVSHFQALSAAVSGTVGLGNIAGVAIGIQDGGPGVAFWLFLSGFIGMSTKFAVCTLGEKPRVRCRGPRPRRRDGLPAQGICRAGIQACGIAVGRVVRRDVASCFKFGIQMTSLAFETVHASFKYVLFVCVFCFAFSTLITWSYYGLQAWQYLFGKKEITAWIYKLIFCLIIIVGSAASMGNATDFSDASLFGMSIPNLIGVYFLLPVVRSELARYLAFTKRVGEGATLEEADLAERNAQEI